MLFINSSTKVPCCHLNINKELLAKRRECRSRMERIHGYASAGRQSRCPGQCCWDGRWMTPILTAITADTVPATTRRLVWWSRGTAAFGHALQGADEVIMDMLVPEWALEVVGQLCCCGGRGSGLPIRSRRLRPAYTPGSRVMERPSLFWVEFVRC